MQLTLQFEKPQRRKPRTRRPPSSARTEVVATTKQRRWEENASAAPRTLWQQCVRFGDEGVGFSLHRRRNEHCSGFDRWTLDVQWHRPPRFNGIVHHRRFRDWGPDGLKNLMRLTRRIKRQFARWSEKSSGV